MSSASTTNAREGIKLCRALGLWDLILYGMIVIQPTALMPVYGVMTQRAHGHAVGTVLIAMVPMLFTAIGYGRMARAYPSAGSAFTYVGPEIHPALGYVTGWSMAMDYMLNPIVLYDFVPQVRSELLSGSALHCPCGDCAVHGIEPVRHSDHGTNQRHTS
jgi:putrescine importer